MLFTIFLNGNSMAEIAQNLGSTVHEKVMCLTMMKTDYSWL